MHEPASDSDTGRAFATYTPLSLHRLARLWRTGATANASAIHSSVSRSLAARLAPDHVPLLGRRRTLRHIYRSRSYNVPARASDAAEAHSDATTTAAAPPAAAAAAATRWRTNKRQWVGNGRRALSVELGTLVARSQYARRIGHVQARAHIETGPTGAIRRRLH